jgi:ATP-dependent DNA helicase RecQ
MFDIDDARQVLRKTFGFRKFRKGQGRIIRRMLEGRSALAVFPTGGGKSLCYQLPALLLDGLTVVVCPLIAQMKDHVDFLTARGVPAAWLDSNLDAAQIRTVYADLRTGRLKLLYVAPERLASERFLHTLARQEVSLLAVDEAHCLSQSGHAFRPEYMRLAQLAGALNVGRILALTATASPQVVRDIADAFGIADKDVIQASFHRDNLELHTTPCRPDERRELLLERLRDRPAGPTIVFVTQQMTAEGLAEFLADEGFDASPYHANLKYEQRREIQEAFTRSEKMVVVATIDFGMGIEKANIRYVYHYNLPRSLEGYAQEIGQAGRDGKPAECELFACADDVAMLEELVSDDTPTAEEIACLVDDVLEGGQAFDVSAYSLSHRYGIRLAVVRTLLTYLELDGILQATGSSYAEYSFHLERPVERMLRDLADGSSDLARRVIAEARRGRSWRTLDVDRTAEQINVPRERIVSVLTALEWHGHVALKTRGARQGYRRLRSRINLDQLCQSMVDRFEEREERDVARVHEVLKFAQGQGCLTRAILSYFGEELEEDCGHCDRCQGIE